MEIEHLKFQSAMCFLPQVDMKKLCIILGIFLIILGVVYTKYMSDLTPTVIVDQPIPLLDGSQTAPSGTASASPETVLVPTTQVDQAFPQAIIARETISQSLNTESKRILGSYGFEQNGAIAIGTFQQGVSGEVDISPDGITAKNVNGDTTFALDGTTGDATFKGTVEANGFTIADENGIRSIGNFGVYTQVNDGANQSFTSATYSDVTGATITVTPTNTVTYLIMASQNGYLAGQAGGDWSGTGTTGIMIDGVQVERIVMAGTLARQKTACSQLWELGCITYTM